PLPYWFRPENDLARRLLFPSLRKPLPRKETVMKRHLTAALLVLVTPLFAPAQEAPERLLPANTQIYLRSDGLHRHRAEFDKTALSKIFQGDLGDMLMKLLADKKEHQLFKLARALGSQGFVVGVELSGIEPPEAQLIAVLPDAKTQWEPLFATLTWL